MKIEKINDNQIKCTLTASDLAKRNLKISELAYGSEKTESLFREMVKQADCEYGFETDNMPLVVEAIPMSSGSIVLIITKIDDPEELDTRFSRFSPSAGTKDSPDDDDDDLEDFPDFSHEVTEASGPSFDEMLKEALEEEVPRQSFMFAFVSIADAMTFAAQAGGYPGESSLYKMSDGTYRLVISMNGATKDEFRNVCLIASEYGNGRSISNLNLDYMSEHSDVLIREKAIAKLG